MREAGSFYEEVILSGVREITPVGIAGKIGEVNPDMKLPDNVRIIKVI